MNDAHRFVVLAPLLVAVAGQTGAAAPRVAVGWDTPTIQGRVAMVDTQRGWLVFSTDPLLSSHLHPFTLTSGMGAFEADVSLDYFVPRAPPTPLDGLPTDLELFAKDPGIAVPVWAILAVGVLFAATAIAALRPSHGSEW